MSAGARPGPGEDRPLRGPAIEHLDRVGRTDRKVVYDGRVVKLNLDSVRFPDGSEGTLELVTHSGASAVLPFVDPPTDPDPRILLVHQYRYAAGGTIYEIPAGLPDSGSEPWAACAARELEEETGYSASELRYLTRIYTTPGFTDEVIHLFAATGLTRGRVDRDDDEFLEVVEMPIGSVLEGVREGWIVDAKSVSVILFAAAFLDEVWEEDRAVPER